MPAKVADDPRLEKFDYDGGGLIEFDVDDQGMIGLPDDFVLREIFSVDVDSPEALAAFCGEWGSLTPWGEDRLDSMRGLHYQSARYDEEDFHRKWIAAVDDKLDNRAGAWIIPVSMMRMHVLYLRGMAAHLQVHLTGGDLKDYQLAWVSHGLNEPHQESLAWMWFDSALNAALRPWHVSVNSDPEMTGVLTGGAPMPTLYQVCGLQLYNYIVEGAPFLRCANERCGQLFTRQRGRAKYGEDGGGWNRSSGVKYCSHNCAKAQSERERRRRKRLAEREAARTASGS